MKMNPRSTRGFIQVSLQDVDGRFRYRNWRKYIKDLLRSSLPEPVGRQLMRFIFMDNPLEDLELLNGS